MSASKSLLALALACGYLALAGCAQTRAPEIVMQDITRFEVLRVAPGLVVLSATITNSDHRAVCIPNDMLPVGVHESDILVVVDEAGQKVDLMPGLPLPGPERIVILQPGMTVPIRPVMAEQYELVAGGHYQVSLEVPGYYCDQILNAPPPYPIAGHTAGKLDQVLFRSDAIVVDLP
ncbi:hypothetical protein [Maricaulis sp.]|uniref:hypothetical protein n=1 Tax=Maricaulis sp. TaxID=1486257 RepID=UPI003A933458